jgi:hypothetical protein
MIEILDRQTRARTLAEIYRYEPEWGVPSKADGVVIDEMMA